MERLVLQICIHFAGCQYDKSIIKDERIVYEKKTLCYFGFLDNNFRQPDFFFIGELRVDDPVGFAEDHRSLKSPN